MKIKQEYGLYNEFLIHISESDSKKQYFCPCCNSELIAKKGKIKIHHFAHKNLKDCCGGLETSLHLIAKEILSKSNVILLPIDFKTNNLFNYKINVSDLGIELNYDSVVLEKRVDNIIPDLIVYSNGFPLLIEIKVTHGIDEIKLDKIARINIPLIEITIDYEINNNQEIIKDVLDIIIFNSTKEKSIIRSPQMCLDRINLINKMEQFTSNLNLKNDTIVLPTKKYLTFNHYTYMEEGYPPNFAFLIADNTEVIIDEFEIISKDYSNGYVNVEISIEEKNVLCIFNLNNTRFNEYEYLEFHDHEKYNSIFVLECNNLNLMQIYELLKTNIYFCNKYFIKNKRMDIIKSQLYYQVKKHIKNKDSIKKFGWGKLYGKQIYGSNCPKTKYKTTLNNCEKCSSLIKQEIHYDNIICGEEFEFKQSFININEIKDPYCDKSIEFDHQFDLDI